KWSQREPARHGRELCRFISTPGSWRVCDFRLSM
ncbi:uncharacterized protein METZ01_LOCUS274180, partial [marine metagenome]